MIEEILHPRYNENIIKDFSDGSFFHKNSVFDNSNNALCLILYFDEFELVNPIGASRKSIKWQHFIIHLEIYIPNSDLCSSVFVY